ncbi:MAG TPA: LacI family DNA-binding transcriptional regulator [Skermanella sp.]|jgi:LacI family transcriptional regulator, fructose operon transcriptional repressor|nr:LacI family DNA-binding transcriptional regulator [Skermanella sp.]
MATAKGQRRSTIYDIATSTGTSPATVSMVLNGTWQRYRISEATATRILDAARTIGYNVNMKARGLRLARSGLAGMIMPHYRNRFFAGLSETFEAGARARGFCPMVVSTQRKPETEREVVERLLSHQVEFLFIVGVANPDPLNELCSAANIPCVNIDLPGANAPSVVTDNQGGARMLTDILLDRIAAPEPAFHFLGGVAGEYATEERIVGFKQALAARGISLPESHIHRCGYWPPTARESIEHLHDKLGGLPAGLFINSITAFEGAIQFFRTLPAQAFEGRFIGCFDWDPFAAFLPFPVTMLRQNVEAMIEQGFSYIENYRAGDHPLTKVPPKLGPSHVKVPA